MSEVDARALDLATQDVTLAPDDPKPPSQEVAALPRGYEIGDAQE